MLNFNADFRGGQNFLIARDKSAVDGQDRLKVNNSFQARLLSYAFYRFSENLKK